MAQLKVIADKLNKRRQIPAAFPDTANVCGLVLKDYIFEGSLAGSNALGTWYVDRDHNFYWGNGLNIIAETSAAVQPVSSTIINAPINLDLPLTHSECIECATWLQTHFEPNFTSAVNNTPFEKELLYAIACQETACCWVNWIHDHTPDEVLARCVFDASGDANGTRLAFPKNTAAFVEKNGQSLADMLIAEANATRALHGWAPKQWVYAGYGIFQYDIQAIVTDPDFFEKKQWYSIEVCLTKVISELQAKWRIHTGDLFNTVKAYNGTGTRADNYAKNVFQFLSWIKAAS